MRKLIFLIAFIFCGACNYAYGQTDPQPVCISQQAANACATNARTIPALEAKIAILEAALVEKDKSIDELKETNRKNVQDLTKAVHDGDVKLATATGQLIEKDGTIVRITAILDFVMKNGRNKCGPLTVICIQ
jgi:hypothetical protein